MDNTLTLSLCYYTVIFNIVNLVLVFQKALEESRKELEKEKRRQRYVRREMQVEFEEQCKLHSEIQKQIQLTKETGASNQVSGNAMYQW